ncbi:MAG: hypothetical protein QME51_09480 [Planctomycetota bacterium]|nr:hypothetical protein [Planctomycetota bacterium]
MRNIKCVAAAESRPCPDKSGLFRGTMLILLTPLEVLLQTITLRRAIFRLILLTGLMSIMVTGYGGMCDQQNNDDSGSSAPPPPARVTSPNPSDGATGVSITLSLSWAAASGATSYDVYFGTDNPPSNIINGMNQAGASSNPGTLSCSTTYYYRIDPKNTSGTTTGNVWSFTTVWGVYTALDSAGVGWYTSIALDFNNKVHISYCDSPNSDLKYATNASGAWVCSTLDSAGSVGGYTSIAIDSNNKVHISYSDGTNHDLKYATNASGSWVYSTLDSTGAVGWGTSIALDSNNKVHISYFDDTNRDLKYATNASGSWVYSTLDSAGDVGRYTSIALDSSNKVHISYFDYTNLDLKYATNK